MSFRRMLPFILINIVVSAVVALAILYWWDSREVLSGEEAVVETAVTLSPSFAGVNSGGGETAVDAAATATPEPEEGPPVHTVQAGETLGRISEFYGIPMVDIMAANGISDPNFLTVGQELIIPEEGAAEPTAEAAAPTVTPEPGFLPSPIPTEPAAEGSVIVEITDVVGAGQLEEEAVQIINSGSSQVALLDWQLTDQAGHSYTFNQVTLFGDGAGILLHTEAGPDSSTDLYWGLTEPLWESGSVLTLLDPTGEEHSTFIVPE